MRPHQDFTFGRPRGKLFLAPAPSPHVSPGGRGNRSYWETPRGSCIQAPHGQRVGVAHSRSSPRGRPLREEGSLLECQDGKRDQRRA
jgi:hypothetical protein